MPEANLFTPLLFAIGVGRTPDRARDVADTNLGTTTPDCYSQIYLESEVDMLMVEHLGKTYSYRGKETHAVFDLTFELSDGRTLGLLGPNGAGKTTTLRILATVSSATAGLITIDGMDVATESRRIRRRIGYVPQAGTLVRESTVGPELVYQGRLFGMPRKVAESRGRGLLESMGADELWDRRAGQLSGGERRKVDIAMGMMNRPSIAFLDEPTVGLDPDARQQLWSLIAKMREEWGTTVVFTTHYLDEAEGLADDILLMEGGHMIAQDTTQRIKDRFARDEVTIDVEHALAADVLAACSAVDGVESVRLSTGESGTAIIVRIRDGDRTLPAVLEAARTRGRMPSRTAVKKGGLQDAFFNLTGKEIGS